MGELPSWYLLLRAARYLGVAPWELADQPVVWARWAWAAESAEATAHKNQTERRGKK